MAFEANRVLFGHDPEPRLLAVEPVGDTEVELFSRSAGGSLERRREPLHPIAWVAGTVPVDGVEYQALKGQQPLGFLAKCADWPTFAALRSELRAAGMPHYAPTDPAHQYLLQSGKTLFKELPYEELRRMQIYLPDAEPGEEAIQRIELADNQGWSKVIEGAAERDLLKALSDAIAERDPDVIEGHDLFRSLLARIACRARRMRLKLLWGRDGSALTSRSSRLQIAEKTIGYPKFTAYGRHFVDTYLLAQFWDVSARELEGTSLEEVAEHFHREGSATQQTRELAELLGSSLFIQAQIFPYTYQEVVLRGNATKINTLFLREYLRQRHSIGYPPETQAFEGGYTDIFKTGVIRAVWHCDVASLYPSVMLRYDCFPESDELGIFRGLLTDLRQFRLEAKKEARRAQIPAERHHWEALQSAFKILINSFYGYLGFAQGHFADFNAASKVTQTGRDLLRQMVAWLEQQGAGVIEIDTDGIYFTPPEGISHDELRAGLAATLPEGIEVDFDARYAAMFSYKAKNYALLTEEGEVILRGGALRSRGMERYLRLFLQEMLRHLLQGNPQAVANLKADYEAKIRGREWPIEMLMKCDTLQESLDQYRRKISAGARNRSAPYELAVASGKAYQPGDQVRYYITGEKAKVAAYENARLVADWNPSARDENVEYYVAKLKDLVKRFAVYL